MCFEGRRNGMLLLHAIVCFWLTTLCHHFPFLAMRSGAPMSSLKVKKYWIQKQKTFTDSVWGEGTFTVEVLSNTICQAGRWWFVVVIVVALLIFCLSGNSLLLNRIFCGHPEISYRMRDVIMFQDWPGVQFNHVAKEVCSFFSSWVICPLGPATSFLF